MRNLKWIALLAIFSACQAQEPDLNSSIIKMETEIKKHAEMDTAIANDLTTAYMDFAKANPQDSLAPIYLSRAADIYKEMDGKVLKSVNTYNKIVVEYKDHPLAARSVFMIGYVFDEKLHDKDRAAKSYQHFLDTYPNNELADDAKSLLAIAQDTLTDEELVEKWMKEAESKKDTNPKGE